jgi:hypothetical protein
VITDMEQFNTVTNRKRFCNAALIENTAGLNSTCETEKNALRDERDRALRAKSHAEKARDSEKANATRCWKKWTKCELRSKVSLIDFVYSAISMFMLCILVQIVLWKRRRVEGSSASFPIII